MARLSTPSSHGHWIFVIDGLGNALKILAVHAVAFVSLIRSHSLQIPVTKQPKIILFLFSSPTKHNLVLAVHYNTLESK